MPLDSPGVTFIVAAKNAERTIQEAVESALGQNYAGPVHVVVTDDGSSDSTSRILKRYEPRITVRRLSTSVGRSAARNIAIASAATPLIAIQDADDVSDAGRLTATVPLLSDEVGVVGGHMHFFHEPDGIWTSPPQATAPRAIRRRLLAGRMALAHPTVVMRTELVRRVGGYDESLPYTEDLDLMLRLSHLTEFAATSARVAHYRHPPTSSWDYLWQTELWRRRVMAKNQIGSGRAISSLATMSTASLFVRQTLKSALRRVR